MIGQTISHYKIVEKLGEGGMGVVYKAQDTKLDRLVALKFLSRQVSSSEEYKARFYREARAAAALSHPNICSIIDIQEFRGEEFLVMEFINGRSLRSRIEEGPMPVSDAVKFARQIAEGLEAAHSKGVIHRDIKPENIIVTDTGVTKIADFGLAALLNAMETHESGRVAGTTAYMSPEQIRGDQVNDLTDIWSLGVTLYEMIAGHRPFTGEYEQAVAYSILNEKPPPVTASHIIIPGELEKIIDRCLEKKPTDRFSDAASLAKELRQVEIVLENPQTASLKSIAVLPFADISPEKDNEYFSEGLTEEIIANLSRLRMLRVVSRTSVMQYDRADKTMKQIAGDLAVHFILEGSVRKHGSELRITTQLVDALQDTTLWSETYRGTLEDIFDIQETVASKIAKALKVRLTPGEKKTLKRHPTVNTEAYQSYLKGRFFWNKRNKASLGTAIRYFEESIAKDPNYALAWAGLADAYFLLSEYGHVTRRDTYPRSKSAIEKALELDDQLAEAHASLASLMMLDEWDWTNAGKQFERAIDLKPNYATAHHWYAEWLLYMGREEEAIREITQAALLDPLSAAILKDMGIILYYTRRYDTAIEEGKKSLELDPGFASAHRLLSLAYGGKGMYVEAIAENQKWGEAGGDHTEVMLGLAQLLAVSGKRGEAMTIVEKMPQEQIASGKVYRGLALVYAALADHDSAFHWLEKAYEIRADSLCSLNVDPKLETIRSDPRFTDMLKKIGLK